MANELELERERAKANRNRLLLLDQKGSEDNTEDPTITGPFIERAEKAGEAFGRGEKVEALKQAGLTGLEALNVPDRAGGQLRGLLDPSVGPQETLFEPEAKKLESIGEDFASVAQQKIDEVLQKAKDENRNLTQNEMQLIQGLSTAMGTPKVTAEIVRQAPGAIVSAGVSLTKMGVNTLRTVLDGARKTIKNRFIKLSNLSEEAFQEVRKGEGAVTGLAKPKELREELTSTVDDILFKKSDDVMPEEKLVNEILDDVDDVPIEGTISKIDEVLGGTGVLQENVRNKLLQIKRLLLDTKNLPDQVIVSARKVPTTRTKKLGDVRIPGSRGGTVETTTTKQLPDVSIPSVPGKTVTKEDVVKVKLPDTQVGNRTVKGEVIEMPISQAKKTGGEIVSTGAGVGDDIVKVQLPDTKVGSRVVKGKVVDMPRSQAVKLPDSGGRIVSGKTVEVPSTTQLPDAPGRTVRGAEIETPGVYSENFVRRVQGGEISRQNLRGRAYKTAREDLDDLISDEAFKNPASAKRLDQALKPVRDEMALQLRETAGPRYARFMDSWSKKIEAIKEFKSKFGAKNAEEVVNKIFSTVPAERNEALRILEKGLGIKIKNKAKIGKIADEFSSKEGDFITTTLRPKKGKPDKFTASVGRGEGPLGSIPPSMLTGTAEIGGTIMDVIDIAGQLVNMGLDATQLMSVISLIAPTPPTPQSE